MTCEYSFNDIYILLIYLYLIFEEEIGKTPEVFFFFFFKEKNEEQNNNPSSIIEMNHFILELPFFFSQT